MNAPTNEEWYKMSIKDRIKWHKYCMETYPIGHEQRKKISSEINEMQKKGK
jgi:hypothetical protein